MVGVCLAGAALAAGCNAAQEKPTNAVKLVDVVVDVPTARSVTDYEEFSGRTEAINLVEVRARVSGYLDQVHFKEGADVKSGELLFEIDPRTYKAELQKSTAEVAQIKARLGRISADYARGERLLKQKVITQEEADRVIYEKAEAEASLAAANATREIAELNVGFTSLKSPITGRISRRYVDPGNLVKADDTHLTTIVALDPLYAYFDIDERTLLRLRRMESDGRTKTTSVPHLSVQVGLADEEGFSLTGSIDFVDNMLDPNTGTLRVRAVIANPKRILAPGLFVRLRLPVGEPRPALLVPEEAVSSDQGQKYIYVLNQDDEVVYRRVKTGPLDGGYRVVESGITPNERVVVSGIQKVRPGTKVRPTLSEKSARRPGAQRAEGEVRPDGLTPSTGPSQASAGR